MVFAVSQMDFLAYPLNRLLEQHLEVLLKNKFAMGSIFFQNYLLYWNSVGDVESMDGHDDDWNPNPEQIVDLIQRVS